MRTRRAKISDAAAIHSLVAYYAAQGLASSPRTQKKFAPISATLSFRKKVIVSSAASRSKATAPISLKSAPSLFDPENRGQGFGARLIASALERSPPPRHRPRFRRHARATIFRAPGIRRRHAPVARRKNRA